RRLREAVQGGLTADAAVERVLNNTRSRLMHQPDPFWRERQRDLDDLSDRLLRILAGRPGGPIEPAEMPPDTILVARTMGPAELLDYDRTKLRGLVVEDGSPQSHVAIVAKALGLAAVARATGIVERASAGDAIIVDGVTGQVHLRPQPEVVSAYSDKARFRAKRQKQYEALREKPAITRDGVRINLQMNAGLIVDMPHLEESGADGIGLFRTELQFMLSRTFPRHEKQLKTYKTVLDEANGKPVVFRALDIGGDKVLPYLRQQKEENPAIGWRAIRMSLDRPALLRTQVRAFLHAASERELRLMIPMVSEAAEIDLVRAQVDKEIGIMLRKGVPPPKSLKLGAMIEVPSLLFELDGLLPKVDFVSIGSNDLMQFLFAADRTNALVGSRYDSLTVAPLRVFAELVKACARHKTPLTLCGEMAGRPLEAMALIGLGYRTLSMAPASVGPVKTMILGLHVGAVQQLVERFVRDGKGSLRTELMRFAEQNGIEI
ncbi:MAG: phosphoenolpyruvate--protein phosphotransferase, partial [Hyphomicrobium sp.]